MLRLPPRMEEILLLVYGGGLREIEVAERLKISKQAVSKALREARGKLAEIFLGIAEVLNADIVRVDISRGFAIIRVRQLNTKAYILYVPGKGARVIFKRRVECSGENESLCRDIMNAAATWRILDKHQLEKYGSIENLVNEVISKLEQ